MDEQADDRALAAAAIHGCRRYRAFISYSREDSAVARWLHRRLEAYRVPRALHGTWGEYGPVPDRLAPIFRDQEELGSAGELGARIRAALADSDALIVVCSPAAAASNWVNDEIREFRRLRRAERIYCLIVAGDPDDPTEPCFPSALRPSADALGALGERPWQPLAADLRRGGDGRALALLRLASGLLGVALDDLRHRESSRRHRRMLAAVVGSMSVAAVTLVLAVQAWVARNDAQRRQTQAEALIEYMLGDLSDRLNEVSRLDIMEAVSDHAMAYFKSQPTNDITDRAIEQRARAFERIGSVRRDQGHLPQALLAYQEAANLAGMLARRQPGNIDRQRTYARELSYLGTVRWYQGDLAGAQHHFGEAQAALDLARAWQPDDLQTSYQLVLLDNNIGHVLEARGQLDAARQQYETMLARCRQAMRSGKPDARWSGMLGLAHNNLGKMALLAGDLPRAIAEFRADVGIREALAQADPHDNSAAEMMHLSRAALARALALAGHGADAIAQMRQVLAGVEHLQRLDAGNSGFTEEVALYSMQLARMLREAGDVEAAEPYVLRALALGDALVARDAGNADWQRERAESMVEQAQGQRARGQNDAALERARAALAVLEPQLAARANDRDTLLATLAARLAAADASRNAEQASGWRQQTLASIARQTTALRDPRLVALKERAAVALAAPAASRNDLTSTATPP